MEAQMHQEQLFSHGQKKYKRDSCIIKTGNTQNIEKMAQNDQLLGLSMQALETFCLQKKAIRVYFLTPVFFGAVEVHGALCKYQHCDRRTT